MGWLKVGPKSKNERGSGGVFLKCGVLENYCTYPAWPMAVGPTWASIWVEPLLRRLLFLDTHVPLKVRSTRWLIWHTEGGPSLITPDLCLCLWSFDQGASIWSHEPHHLTQVGPPKCFNPPVLSSTGASGGPHNEAYMESSMHTAHALDEDSIYWSFWFWPTQFV